MNDSMRDIGGDFIRKNVTNNEEKTFLRKMPVTEWYSQTGLEDK
jgi:hypothetical protein